VPLFDFRCRACSTEFESLVRAASYGDPPTTCPGCGSQDLDRLLASFAVKSAEKTQAAAAAKNAKAATVARRDHIAELQDQEKHRKEDH
jgi:putative FmdB family regulatory protein